MRKCIQIHTEKYKMYMNIKIYTYTFIYVYHITVCRHLLPHIHILKNAYMSAHMLALLHTIDP